VRGSRYPNKVEVWEMEEKGQEDEDNLSLPTRAKVVPKAKEKGKEKEKRTGDEKEEEKVRRDTNQMRSKKPLVPRRKENQPSSRDAMHASKTAKGGPPEKG